MTRFNKIKAEATLEEMAKIMCFITVKIIKEITMEEYGESIEINNFDLCDIEQYCKKWLKYEMDM